MTDIQKLQEGIGNHLSSCGYSVVGSTPYEMTLRKDQVCVSIYFLYPNPHRCSSLYIPSHGPGPYIESYTVLVQGDTVDLSKVEDSVDRVTQAKRKRYSSFW